MVSDDERREVAQRLRMSDERDASGFVDCLLAEVIRGHGFCEAPCEECHARLLGELADLIEPSDHIGDSDKMVDRDAQEGADRGMVTDKERREAARRLREYASWDGEEDCLVDCADWGERVLNLLGCGDTEGECYAALADLIEPQPITGNTSDGYHTFNELYDHRAKLFSVIVRCFKDRAWKSKLHHDGTMYDGMFIVGIETPQGQATYHYDIDPYWDMFDCKELARAPEWDGHTPEQAISRIASLRPSCDRDALLVLAEDVTEAAAMATAVDASKGAEMLADMLLDIARGIREALGVGQ